MDTPNSSDKSFCRMSSSFLKRWLRSLGSMGAKNSKCVCYSTFYGLLNVCSSYPKVLCLDTLSQLVSLFPSSHKQLHASLSALTLKHLNGSSPAPSPGKLVIAASKLYAVLPCTGGKVGASNLWRKSVDETLEFTQSALSWLKADSQGMDILMRVYHEIFLRCGEQLLCRHRRIL